VPRARAFEHQAIRGSSAGARHRSLAGRGVDLRDRGGRYSVVAARDSTSVAPVARSTR
jgi:hypothetical protein